MQRIKTTKWARLALAVACLSVISADAFAQVANVDKMMKSCTIQSKLQADDASTSRLGTSSDSLGYITVEGSTFSSTDVKFRYTLLFSGDVSGNGALYRIVESKTGKCLIPGSTSTGTLLVTAATCANSPSHIWEIENDTVFPGTFRILSRGLSSTLYWNKFGTTAGTGRIFLTNYSATDKDVRFLIKCKDLAGNADSPKTTP
jgi:hypothetical protein